MHKATILIPDIFMIDFERTENSDELHGVFGRALIIATRFDSMCVAAANIANTRMGLIVKNVLDEAEYEKFVLQTTKNHKTLNNSILALGLPADASDILHSARTARNHIAHELSIGLTGCLDTKIDDKVLIKDISELINRIANGDIVISTLISLQNNDPLLRAQFINTYKEKIISWVVER